MTSISRIESPWDMWRLQTLETRMELCRRNRCPESRRRVGIDFLRTHAEPVGTAVIDAWSVDNERQRRRSLRARNMRSGTATWSAAPSQLNGSRVGYERAHS